MEENNYVKRKMTRNKFIQEMFKKYNNVTIIDKTIINGDITLVPWLGDIPEKGKYCFGHL